METKSRIVEEAIIDQSAIATSTVKVSDKHQRPSLYISDEGFNEEFLPSECTWATRKIPLVTYILLFAIPIFL